MKNKNWFKISIALFFLGAVLLFFSGSALAAFTYTPMEQIPGFENTTDFKTYIQNIYNFGIWTIGIAALLMLTIGGFSYMTAAGNTAKTGTAKKIITDSILGLVVAMTAYLLLYVINPDLVGVSVNISPAPATTITKPGTLTDEDKKKLEEIKKDSVVKFDASGECKDSGGNPVSPQSNFNEMSTGKITACYDGCKDVGAQPCTKTIDISSAMVELLKFQDIDLGGMYSIRVTSIAGGDHSSNDSLHYQGKAVDIKPSSANSQWGDVVKQLIDKKKCSDAFCDTGVAPYKTTDCTKATHIHVKL